MQFSFTHTIAAVVKEFLLFICNLKYFATFYNIFGKVLMYCKFIIAMVYICDGKQFIYIDFFFTH